MTKVKADRHANASAKNNYNCCAKNLRKAILPEFQAIDLGQSRRKCYYIMGNCIWIALRWCTGIPICMPVCMGLLFFVCETLVIFTKGNNITDLTIGSFAEDC